MIIDSLSIAKGDVEPVYERVSMIDMESGNVLLEAKKEKTKPDDLVKYSLTIYDSKISKEMYNE